MNKEQRKNLFSFVDFLGHIEDYCYLCTGMHKNSIMMDSLTTFAKENFDLIVLFVSMVGVVLAFVSLIYELKKKKRKKQEDAGGDC